MKIRKFIIPYIFFTGYLSTKMNMKVTCCLLPFLLSEIWTWKVYPQNIFRLKSAGDALSPGLIEGTCVVLLDETTSTLKDVHLHRNETVVSIIHITKNSSDEVGHT